MARKEKKKSPQALWEERLAEVHEAAIIENRAMIFTAAYKHQKVTRKQLVDTVVALSKVIERVNGRAERRCNFSDVMQMGWSLLNDLSTTGYVTEFDGSYSRSCKYTKMSVGYHISRLDATAEFSVCIEYGPEWGPASRFETMTVPAALFTGAVRVDNYYGCPALDGEFSIFENKAQTKATRYHFADGKRTGLARKTDDDPLGHVNGYWEHGATDAEIDAEIQHKREVDAQRLKTAARDRRLYEHIVRRSIPVTYELARNSGLCHAGITAWQERHGQLAAKSVPLNFVAKNAPEAARRLAERLLIEHRRKKAARKCVAV